jgi:hypothetical protein
MGPVIILPHLKARILVGKITSGPFPPVVDVAL